VIVLSQEQIDAGRRPGRSQKLVLRSLDDGDAYSQIAPAGAGPPASCTLVFSGDPGSVDVNSFGAVDDVVRVIVGEEREDSCSGQGAPSGAPARGYVRRNREWVESPVQIVPVKEEIFSRTRGLFETGVFRDACIFTAGLGSGGAPIVLELAKLGLNQILLDFDRVEVGNVVRHAAGLSDVGRRKVNVLAEMVRDKNPYADIEAHDMEIGWQNVDAVRDMVRRSNLVICAVDDHKARVILNKLCVEEDTPMIMAGCFRRAYAGQVLFVQPKVTPCYQCFMMTVPEKARDREISSARDAARIAYSDRPVAIEPGLSADIAPISLMVVKLVIQHLLKGKPTTLESLNEDLAAPWYIWLNRREPGSQYEGLEPLQCNVDGMHVMRWYGIAMERDAGCPACGNFIEAALRAEGLEEPAGAKPQ